MRAKYTVWRKFVPVSKGLLLGVLMLASGLWIIESQADGWDQSTSAPNVLSSEAGGINATQMGGISNTRHNLAQWYTSARSIMDPYRNNYFEVCVYCHTPHGANSTVAAPLWNRTITQRQYTLYNTFSADASQQEDPAYLHRDSDSEITQPGPNSLTCLSCHDGATAIDSIINMPTQISGSGRAGYSAGQQSGVSNTFLDSWDNNQLKDEGATSTVGGGGGHAGLFGGASACFSCHNGGVGPDFRPFVIGAEMSDRTKEVGFDPTAPMVDTGNPATRNIPNTYTFGGESNFLADDHPIGVRYPTNTELVRVDYNEPTVKKARIAFFDTNANNHADANEVRLYDTGDGYEVECASCHDPHGVPLADGRMIPSFLRVGAGNDPALAAVLPGTDNISANWGSQLCLTCHVK